MYVVERMAKVARIKDSNKMTRAVYLLVYIATAISMAFGIMRHKLKKELKKRTGTVMNLVLL
jgi:hypothetical protein